MAAIDMKESSKAVSVPPMSLSDTLSRISPPPARQQHTRERRDPSVTPRKFKRFFAPRSQPTLPVSSARRALHEITSSGLNQSTPSSISTSSLGDGEDIETLPVLRTQKRRKTSHSRGPSPNVVTPQEPLSMSLLEEMEAEQAWENTQSSPSSRPFKIVEDSDDEDLAEREDPQPSRRPLKPIVPMRNRGLGAQLLSMSIGGGHRHARRQYIHVNGMYNID